MKLKTLVPKSEARKMVVARRNEHADSDLRKKAGFIVERLKSQDDFIHAQNIHCYVASRPGEVETRGLIDEMHGMGKSIIIPKLNKSKKSFARFQFMGWDHLVKNNEGYLEPRVGIDEDMSDIDLVIVPALAVSKHGQRVGYGGGYYDKLLRGTFAPKYVLAFEFQIFEYLESSVHDVRVDKIITERRVIDTRNPNHGWY
ncbi:MAG: 5-formyltetrahydrofolate cyclo-ligase [Melioribacteraceae bacterium]|nr:5-formyltetrahydrofolate cyclo-ligase [Melioribacteraceae bacterium]MCF8353331.1 5-formyltetrahydrofolate cyclo-ligase [Melioribacteraceae bacterium]MCF8393195.1 5-formyltetrahydrofolate cyclo-ligase [Melioribacteraceae bacterium]MCF8419057.1 5-formyltetrahydrofolate cyclo-ligase [Melioribacteraceae bacterium]